MMFLPHFDVLCDLFTEQTHGNMESICFIQLRNKLLQLFYFKIFLNYSKADLCPIWHTRKKPFDVICCLYNMKQSHWLLCVAKNRDWSTKITPLSYLTQRASREMKTYSKGRIELRNLQILQKISQFLSSEQPCEP